MSLLMNIEAKVAEVKGKSEKVSGMIRRARIDWETFMYHMDLSMLQPKEEENHMFETSLGRIYHDIDDLGKAYDEVRDFLVEVLGTVASSEV